MLKFNTSLLIHHQQRPPFCHRFAKQNSYVFLFVTWYVEYTVLYFIGYCMYMYVQIPHSCIHTNTRLFSSGCRIFRYPRCSCRKCPSCCRNCPRCRGSNSSTSRKCPSDERKSEWMRRKGTRRGGWVRIPRSRDEPALPRLSGASSGQTSASSATRRERH